MFPLNCSFATGTFVTFAASSDMEKLKPSQKVLIVEDQFLIAMAIEDAVTSAGYDVAGMAACRADAVALAAEADIALVDVNLSDGRTGPQVGAELAAAGASVIFMTANPEQVAGGVDGTLGVIHKPVMDAELIEVVDFAAAHHSGILKPRPRDLLVFD